ncbi:Spatacsin [Halotydeus destructor]|nr:Spatacsin [Halotydeus destructor]
MELGVLELGLKNQQFTNVRCFLKIQTEAFKLKISEIRNAHSKSEIDELCLLFDQWQEIFFKIKLVLKATQRYGRREDFGFKLCRITLQTATHLLSLIGDNEVDTKDDFFEQKAKFLSEIQAKINEIRAVLHSSKHSVLNDTDFNNSRKLSNSSLDLEYEDSDEIIRYAIDKNQLLIAQTWLTRNRGVSTARWDEIRSKTVSHFMTELNEDNLLSICKKLTSIGLPSKSTLTSVFQCTTDDGLRNTAAKELASRNELSDEDIESLNFLEATYSLYTRRNLALNIKIAKDFKTNTGILLPSYFAEEFKPLRHLVDAQDAWRTLVHNREDGHLIEWLQNARKGNSDTYPFFSASSEALDDIIVTDDVFREKLLNNLAACGIFHKSESEVPKLIGRLFRARDEIGNVDILTPSSSHVLNRSHHVDYVDFVRQLIEYSAKNELYHFLVWFATICDKDVLLSCGVDDKLKKLLGFYSSHQQIGPTDILEFNLQLIGYVFDMESRNYKEVLAAAKNNSDLRQVLLYLIQFASVDDIFGSSKNGGPSSVDLLRDVFSEDYPLVFREIERFHDINPNRKIANLYEMLEDTTCFQTNKLFTWQSMHRKSKDASAVQDLPHFSHPKLTGMHGLKANLNFLYYLSEGRPIEAFAKRCIKSTSFSSKRIDKACIKASIVAFFHCSQTEVAASAVIFQELLRNDSTSLRLHLSLANTVLLHAANYLSLTPREQVRTLGTLLKKATYLKDKQAPNRLLQLLVTALTKKYEYNNETTVDECLEWQLVLSFCNEYGLELPTEYLIKCAQNDDWLLFIAFAQMYNYPKDLILSILESFNNGCIADHLEKAFQSNTYKNENDNSPVSILRGKQKTASGKHFRNTLYSRIGVPNTAARDADKSKSPVSAKQSPPTDLDEMRSIASETDMTNMETMSVISRTSADSTEMALNSSHPSKDFFTLLLLCQRVNSVEMWKPMMTASVVYGNPAFALMAYSLTPQNSGNFNFDCTCCWFHASIEHPRKLALSNEPLYQQWSHSDFDAVLSSSLVYADNFSTLRLGMKLFGHERSPLVSLTDFFIQFLAEKEYFKCVESLKTFQEQLWTLNTENNANGEPFMNDKVFIEKSAVTMLRAGLEATSNSYELKILLRHLDFARLQSSFSTDVAVPDFRKLYRLCQCASETDADINILEFMKSQDVSYQLELGKRIVYSLQERQYFSEALIFATTIGLDMNDVTLNEWHVKANSSNDALSFWVEFLGDSSKIELLQQSVLAMFVKTAVDRCSSIYVRCFLLVKSCEICFTLRDMVQLQEAEMSLWNELLSMESLKVKHSDHEEVWKALSKLNIEGWPANQPCNQIKAPYQLPEDQLAILDDLIGKLITAENIPVASRISKAYGYQSQELGLIFTCQSIAKKKAIDKPELELLQKLFQNDIAAKTLLNSKFDTIENVELSYLIDKIASLANRGKVSCKKVSLLFKISVELDERYENMLKQNETDIIKRLVNPTISSNETITLAKEFISMHSVEEESIIELLATMCIEELVSNTSEAFEVNAENSGNFLMLLRLLSNASFLGKRLLEVIDHDVDNYSQSVIVDLHIRAHDCFTTASDIEGIAVVLRNVKCLIIQHLLVVGDYHSMIRLLTGIGRYSEMTYIFEILRENHEFEILLGKGISKDPRLRIALLDSLKGDKEMYPLVALNFSMHREIAEMLESDAKRIIRNVQPRQQNLVIFRDMLERSLNDLVDASESYSKASCYNQSSQCAKLAELVALQISLLLTGKYVINLTDQQVSEFVEKHENCSEAFIVAEAYNHNNSWGTALLNHVIIRSDWTYFRDFQYLVQLTSQHTEEIVNKFILLKSKRNISEINLNSFNQSMCKVLLASDDAKLQIKMFRQLGFSEPLNRLLCDKNSYLRDLDAGLV